MGKYTLCKTWIHQRCNGVRADLLLVVMRKYNECVKECMELRVEGRRPMLLLFAF